MDKIEKQLRDVLGDVAINKLEELAKTSMPKDIEERMAEVSKDAGHRDMVLIVPPGPSRIGRLPDLTRGLNKPIVIIPLEMGDREISERAERALKDIGPPIAIDCQMNPDGSLSFGVVPPDEDHPPLTLITKNPADVKPLPKYVEQPYVPRTYREATPEETANVRRSQFHDVNKNKDEIK